MQYEHSQISGRRSESVIATHKVLRNTYFLLSLTLLFSAAVCAFAVMTNAPYPGIIISIIGTFGLLFLTMALRNSAWGLVSVFAFTGFLGYVLGPTINLYLHTYVNGPQIVLTSLAATGAIFVGLSAYVLVTKKDFSFLGGFLFVALIGLILVSLATAIFGLGISQLIISAFAVLIFSGFILFDTSRIINGGERNYIMATVSLYLDIYNLFVNLLAIFGGTSGRN